MTVLNKAHSKVSETEHENTGIEAAHKTEQKAEKAFYGLETVQGV